MKDKEPQPVSANENKDTIDTIGNPLVSIITPVLNGIKYLEACIQSVLTQSYPNIEHIFVDGASTDGTVDMLSSYQARYPDRIRFVSEPDECAEDAWNKGLRMAKGEIFGHLGSDDISEPDAIQTVVRFFRTNPDACFVFGECIHINAKGEVLGRENVKELDLKELINNSCMIPTCSSFYKREVIEKVGWFDPRGRDLDYWIRVGKAFPMYRIEEVLSRFRVHSESQTGAKERYKMLLRDDCILSRRYGGGIFSGYCRRYYRFVIIEGLRPILGFAYPLIKKLLRM